MRVLHIVGKLDRGGAETWLVQVLRHIDRSKYHFDFLVHSEEPGAYDEEVRVMGARVIPCLSPSKPVKYARNFLRILREYGPYDCVHSHVHHFSGFAIMLAAVARIPFRIAHSHTANRERNASLSRRCYLRGMEALVRAFATGGVAVGKEAADSLFPKGWESNPRWSVQPIGIDVPRYHAKSNRALMRAALGAADGVIIVGHIGRFVEAKNQIFFVDVAEELIRSRADTRFVLVGDGPLRPEIEGLVKRRGMDDRFVFTGVRSDIPQLLSAMDVFLFPSLYEGLPLALLEAQAAGLPCIASTAVTPAADAGIGLLRRVSLNENKLVWAAAVLEATRANKATSTNSHRYSIESSVALLSALYTRYMCPAEAMRQ